MDFVDDSGQFSGLMVSILQYTTLSFLATVGVICHAFHTRKQFYPAMLFLSNSKICTLILANAGFVCLFLVWWLCKSIFFGKLRQAEIEANYELTRQELMEMCLSMTIFRSEFGVEFVYMFAILLFIKNLHWIALKRIDFLLTRPQIPRINFFRIALGVWFLALIEPLMFGGNLANAISRVKKNHRPDVLILFTFEYFLLFLSMWVSQVKFYLWRHLTAEQRVETYFRVDFFRDVIQMVAYILYFGVLLCYYGIPLHLVKDLYDTFRNLRNRYVEYQRYRHIASNLNERLVDATQEDIDRGDSTCIICREEMEIGGGVKKLPCGHLFHRECLRQWLQRQQNCPTCRTSLLDPPSDRNRRERGAERGAERGERRGERGEREGERRPGLGGIGGIGVGFFWGRVGRERAAGEGQGENQNARVARERAEVARREAERLARERIERERLNAAIREMQDPNYWNRIYRGEVIPQMGAAPMQQPPAPAYAVPAGGNYPWYPYYPGVNQFGYPQGQEENNRLILQNRANLQNPLNPQNRPIPQNPQNPPILQNPPFLQQLQGMQYNPYPPEVLAQYNAVLQAQMAAYAAMGGQGVFPIPSAGIQNQGPNVLTPQGTQELYNSNIAQNHQQGSQNNPNSGASVQGQSSYGQGPSGVTTVGEVRPRERADEDDEEGLPELERLRRRRVLRYERNRAQNP